MRTNSPLVSFYGSILFKVSTRPLQTEFVRPSDRPRMSGSNLAPFRHEIAELTVRMNFEPNLACARATSNFLADSKSFLSCVSSVEFSDVKTKSFVITFKNYKLL